MLFNQSYVPSLIEQVTRLGDAPRLKIDLKDGRCWWSTRLYALATLAHEYTSVEWLLFLDAGIVYVGMVRPVGLRRALVVAQPDLDEHYRRAEVPALPPGRIRACGRIRCSRRVLRLLGIGLEELLWVQTILVYRGSPAPAFGEAREEDDRGLDARAVPA
jgi:hypothetical protein